MSGSSLQTIVTILSCNVVMPPTATEGVYGLPVATFNPQTATLLDHAMSALGHLLLPYFTPLMVVG